MSAIQSPFLFIYIPVSFILLNYASYFKVWTCWCYKLQKIANDDPTTFDVTHLQRQLEKVNVSDSSYRKIHCEICKTYSDEIEDEVEADILDQYDDLVEKAISLIERLIAIHDIHTRLPSICKNESKPYHKRLQGPPT